MPTAENKELCRKPANTAGKAGVAAVLLLVLQACGAPPPPPEPGGVTPAGPTAATPALNGRLQADAQEYPWSAIGRVNLAGQGFCNGILIGPRQVLTQARCLYAGREDRWFRPQELHFVAAYQKDSYLADSPVADFTAAPGFNPAGGTSLANLTSNWALVTLRDPIGQQTGWLGLQWDTTELQRAAQQGDAAYLRAGYRSDWPHVISLHFGCEEPQNSLARLCDPTPTELALPPFVAIDGELRVLAAYYLRIPRQSDPLPRLTGYTVSNSRLGRSQAPASGNPVGRQPTATVSRLLEALGYGVTGGDIAAAAAAFRGDHGLPPGGGVDVALLTALLTAAQNGGR